MKKPIKNRRQRTITRREFVGGLAAAGIVTSAPALLRGRNLNDKLNIAFIGCGGRGLTNINELTVRPAGTAAPGAGRGEPIGGGRFPVRFYLTAMLFIIFDIEIIFLYPWAVTFNDLGLFGFVEMVLFIGTVFIAFAYVWRRGGLDWD